MGAYDTTGGTPRHDRKFDKDSFKYCRWLLSGYGREDVDPGLQECSTCPVRQHCDDWLTFETCGDPGEVRVAWCEVGKYLSVSVDGLTSRKVSEKVAVALYEALNRELEGMAKNRLEGE